MAVDIVIPTYNCAAWLDTLIQSILAQDYADWRVIARDDASKDDTVSILRRWQGRLGDRMVILDDSGRVNLGMIGNYNAVLTQTTAPWVMLADPDDVWLPNKISVTLDAMRNTERASPASTPVAVCTDARVVDDRLSEISPSHWQWFNQNPDLLPVFHRTIVESAALTSTMMLNQSLLQTALPLTGASCPDWWLALTACAFGRIVSIPQCTVLYRRHPANDSLAPLASTLPLALGRLRQARGRVAWLVRQYAPQAAEFLHRFGDRLAPADAAALEAAAALTSMGPLARRRAVIRHRLWFASPVKNAGLMLFL